MSVSLFLGGELQQHVALAHDVACLGLLQLSRRYGKTRLEQACAHALAIPTTRYASVASILKQGLDRQPMRALPEALDDLPFEDRLGMLLDREVLHRDNRRLDRLLHSAHRLALKGESMRKNAAPAGGSS